MATLDESGEIVTVPDGNPVHELRRLGKSSGLSIYCDAKVTNEAFAALVLHPEDYAFGNPGEIAGVALRTPKKGGRVSLYSAEAFGGLVGEDLKAFFNYMEYRGWGLRKTSGALASHLVRTLANPSGPLLPRFREFFHHSIYVGPITHVRGGSGDASHIDMRQAYMHGLTLDLPVGEWLAIKGSRGMKYRGFAHALAHVKHTRRIDQMPPLPARHLGRVVYPVGHVEGIWPIEYLKRLEEAGEITIEQVFNCVISPKWERRLLPVHDLIASIPTKAYRKAIYTRIWGKLASRGYWRGFREPGDYDGQYFPIGGLHWREYDRFQGLAGFGPDTYRPDWASVIVHGTLSRMVEAIRTLKADSLVAAHIDSIMTSDNEGAAALVADGRWKMLGRGVIRAFGHGIYDCQYENGEEKLGAMGLRDKRLTRKAVREWAGRRYKESESDLAVFRTWYGNPVSDGGAFSRACFLPESEVNLEPDPFDPNQWTPGGYWVHARRPGNADESLE